MQLQRKILKLMLLLISANILSEKVKSFSLNFHIPMQELLLNLHRRLLTMMHLDLKVSPVLSSLF
jgi:hypothetical protein